MEKVDKEQQGQNGLKFFAFGIVTALSIFFITWGYVCFESGPYSKKSAIGGSVWIAAGILIGLGNIYVHRNTLNRTFKAIALASACFAVIAFGASFYYSDNKTWQGVSIPIQMKAGYTAQLEIEAKRTAEYRVEIEGYKKILDEKDKESTDPFEIINTDSKPFALVTITESNNEITQSKFGNGWYTGRYIELALSDFSAVRGLRYSVRIRILENHPDLQKYEPQLHVALDPLVIKGESVGSGLAFLFGIVFALPCLISLLILWRLKHKQWKD